MESRRSRRLTAHGNDAPSEWRTFTRVAALAIGLLFLTIYLPAIGHGFLKDDFAWIETARVSGPGDLVRIFSSHTGFYRPLVTLTFSTDYALWGLQPFGYGATNLLLGAACALLLYRLVRRLGATPAAGLVAAGVWLFNFHAVNMALLWLSGRTSLLVTLFALATADAMVRRRTLLAGLFCACALLSKEEAVLLPALWWVHEAWRAGSAGEPTAGRSQLKAQGAGPKAQDLQAHQGSRLEQAQGPMSEAQGLRARAQGPRAEIHALRRSLLPAAADATARTWPLWLALAGYALLRTRSGAFTASTAPSYYQFSTDPGLVLHNLLAYADRAGTVAAITIIVLVIAVGWRAVRLAAPERGLVQLAIVWIPATYALTVFLPVRSSLYALLPSIGSALVAAAIASAAHRAAPLRFRRAAAGLLVLVLALLPVYSARNERWTGAAEISAEVMLIVEEAAARQPTGHVVLRDAPAAITFEDVFSGLFGVGVQLFAGPRWTGELIPPGGTVSEDATLAIDLEDGMPVVIKDRPMEGGTSVTRDGGSRGRRRD